MRRRAKKTSKPKVVYRFAKDIPEEEINRRFDRAFGVVFSETLKRRRGSE